MKNKCNVILSNFNFLSSDATIKIFNANFHSFYGCPLINIKSRDIKDLDKCWRICSRRILKLPRMTHCT